MTIDEFDKYYIRRYTLLENDFLETVSYVSVEPENFNTYSQKYLNLLLAIGSEVDLARKLLANLINGYETKDKEVVSTIMNYDPEIKNLEVLYLEEGIKFKPWNYNECPEWRSVYTNVKHKRHYVAEKIDENKTFFQCANLKNVLEALAGLHSLIFYIYFLMNKNDNTDPVPPIRCMFRILNSHWAGIDYGSGVYIYNDSIIINTN